MFTVNCPGCSGSGRIVVWGTLGNRLRLLREASGLTMLEIESTTGVLPSTISRIEGGQVQHPTEDTLRRLAAVYGVTMDRLLSPDRQETPEAQPPE